MANWIELNNGDLVNLDRTFCINKYEEISSSGNRYYTIIYHYNMSYDHGGYREESFDNKEDRDKRFKEIAAMLTLIGNF